MAKQPISSIYRTTWQTAKRNADPEAVKRCDFSKGLGPSLDKFDKAWDEIVDLEDENQEVPDKKLKAFEKLIVDTQKIIVKYYQQVLAGNQKKPELGASWLAFHKALMHLDETMIDMVRDGIQAKITCKKITGWASKSDFERPQLNATKVDVPPDPEAWGKLMKKVAGKRKDPQQAIRMLGKAAESCLPYHGDLKKIIQNLAGGIMGGVGQIEQLLKRDPPDVERARSILSDIKKIAVQEAGKISGPGATILVNGLNRDVWAVLEEKIAAVE